MNHSTAKIKATRPKAARERSASSICVSWSRVRTKTTSKKISTGATRPAGLVSALRQRTGTMP